MQWVAAAWGAVTVGLLWMMVRIIRPWMNPQDMKALGWMTLAAAAAAAPGALAPIGGRVLTIALLPASGVAALLMARGVAALRTGAMTGARKRLVGVATAGLVLGHLLLGPIVRVAAGAELTRIGREQYRNRGVHTTLRRRPGDPGRGGSHGRRPMLRQRSCSTSSPCPSSAR